MKSLRFPYLQWEEMAYLKALIEVKSAFDYL